MNKMLKVKLIGLCLLLGAFILAQNLDEKKSQLDELNKKIDEESKLIKEVEQKTQNTKEDISSTKSKKSKAEKKISQLKKSESNAKSKLDVTMSELDLANQKLSDLHDLCELEFNKLCLVHYLSMIYPERKMDTKLLSSIIQQTTAEINTRDDEKTGLEKKKTKNTKKYEDIIWTRIVTNKQKKKYTMQQKALIVGYLLILKLYFELLLKILLNF